MDFKDLDVWQRSVQLSASIYKKTCDCRDYGFRNQLTRSGLSIPSNIAEGLARLSDRETLQFLSIAKGSAAELETQILIGREIAYIDEAQANTWLAHLMDIQAMLMGLIRRYRRTIDDSKNR